VESYHPSQEEFEDLQNDYDKNAFKKAGFGFNDQFKLYRCSGCEKCSGSGYKGRVRINELIEATQEIKQLKKAGHIP
jgi:type II secretory ATPase GspE/PulE/Tfp pilus assembly ATPase PilB-like protein